MVINHSLFIQVHSIAVQEEHYSNLNDTKIHDEFK